MAEDWELWVYQVLSGEGGLYADLGLVGLEMYYFGESRLKFMQMMMMMMLMMFMQMMFMQMMMMMMLMMFMMFMQMMFMQMMMMMMLMMMIMVMMMMIVFLRIALHQTPVALFLDFVFQQKAFCLKF